MPDQRTSFKEYDAVRGIDVYHHSGPPPDCERLVEANISFAFVHATTGIHSSNPNGQYWYDSMAAKGILCGFYHSFKPLNDAKSQATWFLSYLGEAKQGHLPVALEVTTDDQQEPAFLIEGISVWLSEVEEILERRPIIFTNVGFWNARMRGTSKFSEHPLWIADYSSKIEPNIPKGFSDYLIWQFTDSGEIRGAGSNLNLNLFKGSLKELHQLTHRQIVGPGKC